MAMELESAREALMGLGRATGAGRVEVLFAPQRTLAAHDSSGGNPAEGRAELSRRLIGQAFDTGRTALFYESGLGSADPALVETRAGPAAAIPIRTRDATVGVLFLDEDLTEEVLSPRWAALIEKSCALLVGEALAREWAETSLRLIDQLSAPFTESLEYASTIDRVARLFLPFLGDACVLDVTSGAGRFRRVTEAHMDPVKEERLRSLRRHQYRESMPTPVLVAMKAGQPRVFADLPDQILVDLGLDSFEIGVIRELGLHSVLVVPLVARQRVIGALAFCAEQAGRYGQREIELASQLGRHAALAIDNARLWSEAREAIRLRDEFLVLASHELNTPVAALKLAVAGLALSRPSLVPEDLPQRLGLIERQTSRLAALISQMLEAARFQTEQPALHLEQVDLAAVARETVARSSDQLARAGCSVSLEANLAVRGRWDRARLEQVVGNLLANAMKFGAGKSIAVTVNQEGDLGRLVIRDQGSGIPADQRAAIFEAFGRAVSYTHFGGLGLGLYVVRSIVEALDGAVDVESVTGVGATFTVDLPLAGPKGGVARRSLLAAGREGGSATEHRPEVVTARR
jgi:signal transduction histidine kinase